MPVSWASFRPRGFWFPPCLNMVHRLYPASETFPQQNLLLERLAEQSQRLADGVEALTQTLGRLVEALPARGASPASPGGSPGGGTVCRPARASQGSRTGPETFSGMILKVEEET